MTPGEQLRLIERWTAGKIKRDSAEEISVRRLVARQLRASSGGILSGFINAIDPDVHHPNRPPTISFKSPPGNRSKLVDHRNVAAVIWHEVNAGRSRKAYQHAVAELGVSLRTAKAAYKHWRPIFEQHGSKLKALTRIEKQ